MSFDQSGHRFGGARGEEGALGASCARAHEATTPSLPLSPAHDTLPAPPPDADAQSTTVGIVALGVGDHRGGVPCSACVTCACDAAPSVDEEGLCLGCGGVPVAAALLFGELHVGPTEELAERARNRVALLIEEELRFQAGDRPAVLPPEGDERAGWPTVKGWATKLDQLQAEAGRVVEALLGGPPSKLADRLLVDLAARLGRLPDGSEVRTLLIHLRATSSELAARAGDLGGAQ
jgi:hypothetical protein